jgi:hypothetical protein
VTDDNSHVTGPFAFTVPVACHVALVSGSTFATAATPSPTAFPDESLNCTWIAYALALLL